MNRKLKKLVVPLLAVVITISFFFDGPQAFAQVFIFDETDGFTNEAIWTLDDDNTAVGSNVEIIANQGSDNDGILRYNATDNQWEISNDGNSFGPLAKELDLPAVQVRQTATIAVSNGSFADVTFNTTDIEVEPTILEHDNSLTDNINILSDGIYEITYEVSLPGGATATLDGRVRVNDTSVISGSTSSTGRNAFFGINDGAHLSKTMITSLSDGDFITLQLQTNTAGVTTGTDSTLLIHKMDGASGGGTSSGSISGTDSTTFTLDQDNAGSGADVSLVANQGSDNDGEIRYNSSTNQWELSNNGGVFSPIATSSSSVDLDDAYNNFGANASTINVDAAEGQTGGLNISGSLAGDETLTVSNSAAGGAMLVENTGAGTSFRVNDTASDTSPFVVDGNGDMGIGTTNPDRAVDVERSGANFGADYATIEVSTTGAAGYGPSITLDATSVAGGQEYIIASTGSLEPTGAGSLLFFDFSNLSTRMVIDPDGEVGLGGELTPAHPLDIDGTGEVVEIGDGTASDLTINFNDDDGDHNFGWDDSEESFSTFDEEMRMRVRQGSTPPEACTASVTGMLWFDTDSGITYSCDTSNGRNKWLSISEFSLSGGETSACGAGSAPTVEACTMDIHNGTNANDLGYQLARNATIVGGSFHSDASCTDGSGVDLEVANGDNGTVAILADVLTGCVDANGCSAVGLNVDISTDEVIRARLDNNCASGSVNDWSAVIWIRYRHDFP